MYAELADALTPKIPVSFVGNKFIPTERGYHKELDRIESNIGRYTPGFRFYECYESYRLRYPTATIQDYQNDMNSEISYEEFRALSKAAWLYEAQYDPVYAYKNRFLPG